MNVTTYITANPDAPILSPREMSDQIKPFRSLIQAGLNSGMIQEARIKINGYSYLIVPKGTNEASTDC